MDYNNIIVEEGQSLFDISIQEYGTIDAVFLIVKDNGFNSIDISLSPGDELKIRKDDPLMDKDLLDYIQKNKIKISNGEEDIAVIGNMVIVNPLTQIPTNPFIIAP